MTQEAINPRAPGALDALHESPVNVPHLQVLSLRTGDVLVVRCRARLSLEQAARVRATAQSQIPGHECLVMDDGTEIGAVRPAANVAAKTVQP